MNKKSKNLLIAIFAGVIISFGFYFAYASIPSLITFFRGGPPSNLSVNDQSIDDLQATMKEGEEQIITCEYLIGKDYFAETCTKGESQEE